MINMKNIILILTFILTLSACSTTMIKIDNLQGAWWSDFKNPTADFGISRNEVWLDYDSQYHPCKIEGDILVFDLGMGHGLVKYRIISLNGDILYLQNIETKHKQILTRVKSP